jgi:hypothetical protein
MGSLPMKSAEARDKDIYLAFNNSSLDKVGKQLRRAKRELREDKAERVDKDVVQRERPGPTGTEANVLSDGGVTEEFDDQHVTPERR